MPSLDFGLRVKRADSLRFKKITEGKERQEVEGELYGDLKRHSSKLSIYSVVCGAAKGHVSMYGTF